MHNARNFSYLILLLLLSSATGTPNKKCKISISRVTGRTEEYVWACLCPNASGVPTAVGRARVPALPGKRDSAAQSRATLRCIRYHTTHVLHACQRSPKRFEKKALPLLRECVNAPLTAADRKKKGPFRFNVKRCRSGLRRFVGPAKEVASLSICACPQFGNYQVVPGRALFENNAGKVLTVEELDFIQQCSKDTRAQLREVCRNSPTDFELLALQLIQVCCKRARVFTNLKFQCRAVVPDDVTGLKFFD